MSVPRVAYLVEQCWHRVPGGTAVATAEIANALVRRDDVELKGIAARHKSLSEIELSKDLHVTHSKLPRQLLYSSWQSINRPKVESLIEGVDLVHASGGAIPPTRLPLISTINDLSWRHNPSWFPARGRRFAEKWLESSFKADLIICPSETTRQDLVEAGFDSKKIRVVHLGVKQRKVENKSIQHLRQTYGLEESFVLWMGTIEPRKNLPTLIEAISRIPKVNLVLIGPNGWKADVEKIIKPIKDRVRLVGKVEEEVKHIWLEAADIFCFPSLLEGFGLPVVEAMSHGTPVVTSATTATAEIVKDSGILVDPQKAEEIAEAILKILENRDLSQELSGKGRERSKKFSWKSSAELTVKAYKEVLN